MSGLISRLACTSGGGRIASSRAAVGGAWPKCKHSAGFRRTASRSYTMNCQTIYMRYSFHSCRRYVGSIARPTINNVIASQSHTVTKMSSPGVALHGAGKVAPSMQLLVGRYSQHSHKTKTQRQGDIPYPNSLKENEYTTFKAWFNNCIEFCLPGCSEQIHHLMAGEKSMSQVYAEQHKLIENIANTYKQYGLHLPSTETTFCPFTAQGVQEGFGGVDMEPVINRPCPEGIQDLDCQSLKQYLDLCKHYRFTDCEGQLEKLHTGKKSITDLLEDREKLLQDVVHYYDATVSKATDDSMSSTHKGGHEGATELSQMQRFKQMVKEYGTVVVIFHVCISLISLGICYTLVSSGVDLVSLITKLKLLPADFNTKVVAGASTFVIAYAFHKMFVPVRMGITLASAPLIVRYLRRIGFLNAPKTK